MSQFNDTTPGFRPGEDWPTIAELAQGYDEYMLPESDKLNGKTIELVMETGASIEHQFTENGVVNWRILDGGDGGYKAGLHGEAKYRALEVRDDIFFIDFYKVPDDEEVTIILNVHSGQAVIGVSGFHDVKGAPRTHTKLFNAHAKGSESAEPFPTTEELLGKHVFYRYNSRDCYEHIYQNPGTFAWHCLSGIEKGVASTDPCKFLKLSDELYLIYWAETVMPVESMVVSDLKNLRSTGRFFCWDPKPRKPLHMVFGSYATVLADTKARKEELLRGP